MCSYRYSVGCCACWFISCAFCTVSQLITTVRCLAPPIWREILEWHHCSDDVNGKMKKLQGMQQLECSDVFVVVFWWYYLIGCGCVFSQAKGFSQAKANLTFLPDLRSFYKFQYQLICIYGRPQNSIKGSAHIALSKREWVKNLFYAAEFTDSLIYFFLDCFICSHEIETTLFYKMVIKSVCNWNEWASLYINLK